MLNDKVVKFAEKRRIARRTLERLPVDGDTVFFPALNRKTDAVLFRYHGGWKARALSDKAFVSSKGFVLSFWNLAAVMGGPLDVVYLTEGEFDACALVEAGIDAARVLSVPNGAKQRIANAAEDVKGYGYVLDALKAGLGRAKRFVWCGDADAPGLALRADMARLLGAARFHYVSWPEGVKDGNDFLIHDGGGALYDIVTDGALVWPISGLYRLSELPEPAPMTLWSTGLGFDRNLMLAPKTLSVVTGQPGHGKTMLFGQIWFSVVERYNLVACVASFESSAKPHIRRQLRTLHQGILERDMTDDMRREADAWIDEHYLFLVHPDRMPTLAWFLDRAEAAVVRHGAKIIQLDPWNRLEASRAREQTETEYIGQCLREIYNFANDLNCHAQIIAHPSKMEGARRERPPLLEDISGSKSWDAMVDQGFTVHRPRMFERTERRTEALLFHRKARFDQLGFPCRLPLKYDLTNGRYEVPRDDVEQDAEEF